MTTTLRDRLWAMKQTVDLLYPTAEDKREQLLRGLASLENIADWLENEASPEDRREFKEKLKGSDTEILLNKIADGDFDWEAWA